MALQQGVPDFSPARGLGASAPKPLKRMVRPVPASFRRGGSLRELLGVVSKNRAVAIEASAGAGKSTIVPGSILDEFGGLLIHMLPTQFLALELSAYVSTFRQDCVLVDSVSAPWPESGWVITYAAVVEAKFLSQGSMVLPDCVLYHDEVHRSDCWTYLISQQWGNIQGLQKYVTASATSSVSGFRALEADGKVTFSTFDPVYMDKMWDVHTDGMPWSISSAVGNMLIFEDRSAHVTNLVEQYGQAGFDVFRLHSRMKPRVFQAAMESLRSSDLTVLIADSTFRDGYTFDLSVIIDTGRVCTASVIEGRPAMAIRNAYEGEVYQGGARGGRTKGSEVVVWKPDVKFDRKRVVLEEVEMEAVALVSRLLCTLVPLEATDAVMAEGNVPRDLVAALKSTQPLACLTDMQVVPLSSAGYERSSSPVLNSGVDVRTPGLDYDYVGVSADVANKRHFRQGSGFSEVSDQRGVVPQFSDPGSISTHRTSVSGSASSDWTSELAAWASEAVAESVDLECGCYYYSPSVRPDVVASAEFPDGWASVLRLFGAESSLLLFHDLNPRAREVAVAAGLQRFNMISCERNAVMAVAKDIKALGRTRAGPMVHTWMNQLLEKATGLNAESFTISRLLTGLVQGFCQVLSLPQTCLDAECRAMASHMFEKLRMIPMAEVSADQAVSLIKNSVPLPQLAVAPAPVLRGATDERYIEMARRGRTSRAKPPMTPLARWVVGYDHNPSVKKLANKLV